MLPLSAPSALKPTLVGVGVAACAPPASSTPSRLHRTRNSLSSRRVSLDVSRLSLDGRRTSSFWPSAAGALSPAALTSSSSELMLEPFGMPWAFASAADLTMQSEHHVDSSDTHLLTRTSSVSTASRPAAAAPAVPQQVTRHNFHLALPLVTQALEECTFFALDCEFTGLSPQAPHFSELYDDAADRYQRVLSSSQQFTVMQLGLSMFVRDEATGAYTSRTFNFSVFPKPSGPNDRRFLCQASSLEFLASQGFDFNRWVCDGIPYLQLSQRDHNLLELSMKGMTAPAPATAALSDFALTGGFSQVLELIRRSNKPAVMHNGLADMVYTLQQFACPLPENWDEFKTVAATWFPGGVFDTRVLASQVMAEAQLPGLFPDLTLSKVNTALAPGGTVEDTLLTRSAASATETAAPLMEQLPSVTHAPGYALYPDGAQGTSAQQPAVDAVHGMAAVEPACLMASPVPSSSSAISPFAAVEANATSFSCGTSHPPIHEAGYDAYLTGAVFARLARAAELLLPQVAPADAAAADVLQQQEQGCGSCSSSEATGPATPCPGSPRSDHASASVAPSESAGFTTASGKECSVFSSPVSALQAWRGRLHSMRADVPYLHLYGADPLPVRPHVFYLSNLSLHTKVSTVATKFSEAGLGKVRVVMLGPAGEAAFTGTSNSAVASAAASGSAMAVSKSAFVQLVQPELADAVLPAVKAMGMPWKAVAYAEYHASKLRSSPAVQRGAASGGAMASQAVAQAPPQPKYKLVKVPEEEQQQGSRSRAAGGSLASKAGAGGAAEGKLGGQQGARQRPTLAAVASSEGATGAAAPKRYITVMRKVATAVLAPMQQQQAQQQQQQKQQQKQAEGSEACSMLLSGLALAPPPPPPPPPPRTPPKAALVDNALVAVA